MPLQAFSYYQEYNQKQKALAQIKAETSLQLQEALIFLDKLDREAALKEFKVVQEKLLQIKEENPSLLIAQETSQKIVLILNDASFINLDATQKAIKWSKLLKEILPRVLIIKNSLKNI